MAELKFDISKVVEGAIKEFKHQGYHVSKWISVMKHYLKMMLIA